MQQRLLPALLAAILLSATGLPACDQAADESSTTVTETQPEAAGDDEAAKEAEGDEEEAASDDAEKKDARADAEPKKKPSGEGGDKDEKAANDDERPPADPYTGTKDETETADPDKGGKPFKGPASKAIVGTWDVKLDDASLPKGVGGLEQVREAAKGEMTFDGEEAEVTLLGQKRKLAYEVVSEDKETLKLEFPRSQRGQFTITFVDHDHIKIKEDRQNPQLLGTRKKK